MKHCRPRRLQLFQHTYYCQNNGTSTKRVYNEFDNIDENIDFINKFQYGAYTSMGFNTWNFYVYYSLTSILKEGTKTVDSLPVEIVPIKLGLIFYIL